MTRLVIVVKEWTIEVSTYVGDKHNAKCVSSFHCTDWKSILDKKNLSGYASIRVLHYVKNL